MRAFTATSEPHYTDVTLPIEPWSTHTPKEATT